MKNIDLLKHKNIEYIKYFLYSVVYYNQKLRPIEKIKLKASDATCGRERFRERVRRRDGNECQLCGLKRNKNNRRLDVHHIYDERGENTRKCDSNFENMITLCHKCHLTIDGYKMKKCHRLTK